MEQSFSTPLDAISISDGAGQRTQTRDSLFLAAALRISGEEVQVRVRNLSAGGLMAEYPRGAAPGTPLEIEVRGIGWTPGKVAWCAEGRIGVAFDYEIDPKLARKPVGQGTQTPIYAKSQVFRGSGPKVLADV